MHQVQRVEAQGRERRALAWLKAAWRCNFSNANSGTGRRNIDAGAELHIQQEAVGVMVPAGPALLTIAVIFDVGDMHIMAPR